MYGIPLKNPFCNKIQGSEKQSGRHVYATKSSNFNIGNPNPTESK
jgi:hypothetical protein